MLIELYEESDRAAKSKLRIAVTTLYTKHAIDKFDYR